ncbi:ABC transporter substrate-binding protein [Alphaproteobacteria bacterium AO1-B]|nr:ABC transporter substrate-binding protein [Alphaproteobacteria bacterium AO1-B]
MLLNYRVFLRSVSPIIVLISAMILVVSPGAAQEAGQAPEAASGEAPLTVGVRVSPPFVMQTADGYSGMAIELWEELAAAAGLEYQYEPYPNVRALIDATAEGQTDAAISNLTITKARLEKMDFTQPWFDSGLRIMVGSTGSTSFWEVVNGLQEAGFLKAYGWLAFVIVVATLLMTLFDRRFDKSFSQKWPDGLADSFYSVMSVVTSGKAPSRKNLFGWIGRVWQAIWLVCGLAVMAFITSSVTSVMTTLSLNNQIQSVADLPGKVVGVFDGSVGEDYSREQGWSVIAFDGLDEAVEALSDGEIDAFVGDAPTLEYYDHTNPNADVEVVGPLFDPNKYGFALSLRSPYTRTINIELLAAKEAGKVEDLRVEYLGPRE